MFFESLKIHGYGCLRTEVAFAPDRLNLIIADNETGKSTLVSALLAALYGIESDRRRVVSKRPHMERVLPWTEPDRFGVRLDFTMGRTTWRLERDFHTGEVRLIDRSTGKDHSDEYHVGHGRYRIGEKLIGMSVSDFLKCFYLEQQGFGEIRKAGGLMNHLQKVATAAEGEATSQKALERLRLSLRKYPHPSSSQGLKIENAIKRYRDELDKTSARMEKLARQRAGIEQSCARLEAIKRETGRLQDERRHYLQLGNQAELIELTRLLKRQRDLKTRRDKLAATADKIKDYADFPADKWDRLIHLTGKLEEIEGATGKLRSDIRTKAELPLSDVEDELKGYGRLGEIEAKDAEEFENALSLLEDHQNRYESVRREYDQIEENLDNEGFDRRRFDRLKRVYGELGDEDIRLVAEFPALRAGREAVLSEKRDRRKRLQLDLTKLELQQKKKSIISRVIFIAAAVLAISGGSLMVFSIDFQLGRILAGAGIIIGAVGAFMRGASGSSVVRRTRVELAAISREEAEAKQSLDRTSGKLREIAHRIELADEDELLEGYTDLSRMKEQATPLVDVERDLERVRNEREQALDRVRGFFTGVGEAVNDDETLIEKTRELLTGYRKVVELKKRLSELTELKRQLSGDLKRETGSLESHRSEILDILKSGGVKDFDPLEDAVERFRQGKEKRLQYRSIVEEKIPVIEREMLSQGELSEKIKRAAHLKKEPLPAEDGEAPNGSKEQYRERADEISREIDELTREQMDIRGKIDATIQQYESQYPDLQRRQDKLKHDLDRVERFHSEIQTAAGIMEEIADEVYRTWAAALDEEVTPLLRALNHNYSDLKFDNDLSFTVTDRKTNRIIRSDEIENILSTGARDEIFLAARLGIAGYLSRGAGDALPVVLDEPLATADDEKFLSGMKFFIDDLSLRHQVLIISCHALRHQWLKQITASQFERRTHLIEIRS